MDILEINYNLEFITIHNFQFIIIIYSWLPLVLEVLEILEFGHLSWNVLEFPTFLSIVLEMSWNFLRSLNPFFYMQFFNCAIKSNEHQELCLSLLYISSLLIIGSTIIPFHGLMISELQKVSHSTVFQKVNFKNFLLPW